MRFDNSEVSAIVAERMGTSCLYCLESTAGSTSEDHPLLEAMGNDATLPVGFVCDGCNQYLGTHVDQALANYFPILSES